MKKEMGGRWREEKRYAEGGALVDGLVGIAAREVGDVFALDLRKTILGIEHKIWHHL